MATFISSVVVGTVTAPVQQWSPMSMAAIERESGMQQGFELVGFHLMLAREDDTAQVFEERFSPLVRWSGDGEVRLYCEARKLIETAPLWVQQRAQEMRLEALAASYDYRASVA